MDSQTFKACAYKVSSEIFERIINDSDIRYCKRVKRDKDIYEEYIASFVDINNVLSSLLTQIESDANHLLSTLDELSVQICRLIYNTKENILYIIAPNLLLWSDFLTKRKIERMKLINDNTVQRLAHNQINDLIEVELDTFINDEMQSFILSGDSLESNLKFKEYFKNVTKIIRYAKKVDSGVIEIGIDNIIMGTDIKKSDLARIINKCVVKE